MVEDCKFVNSSVGIIMQGPIEQFGLCNHEIINCDFMGQDFGIRSSYGVDGLLIANCRVEPQQQGISLRATVNIQVVDCIVIGASTGYQMDISSGEMSNCQVFGREGYENGTGVALLNSTIAVNNCNIDMSMTSAFSALSVSNHSTLSGSNNVIKCGGSSTMWIGAGSEAIDFAGNEIYKGTTHTLVAQSYNPNMQGPFVHFDFTNNYWGTDDPDSIAAWIDDANDHPNNPHYWGIVDFEPFESEPVPVEKKSLGGLKSMFR